MVGGDDVVAPAVLVVHTAFPTPGSDRGPSLTLTQTMGLSATGGADALLGRGTLAGLAADDDGDELQRRRLEVKLGYGYGIGFAGNRGVLTPYVGMTLGDAGDRTVRTGTRWQFSPDAVVSVEASRWVSDRASLPIIETE